MKSKTLLLAASAILLAGCSVAKQSNNTTANTQSECSLKYGKYYAFNADPATVSEEYLCQWNYYRNNVTVYKFTTIGNILLPIEKYVFDISGISLCDHQKAVEEAPKHEKGTITNKFYEIGDGILLEQGSYLFVHESICIEKGLDYIPNYIQ